MVWRVGGFSIYNDGMSLPKEIILNSSSSMSGIFVLAEGVIYYIIAMEADDIH